MFTWSGWRLFIISKIISMCQGWLVMTRLGILTNDCLNSLPFIYYYIWKFLMCCTLEVNSTVSVACTTSELLGWVIVALIFLSGQITMKFYETYDILIFDICSTFSAKHLRTQHAFPDNSRIFKCKTFQITNYSNGNLLFFVGHG